MMMTIKRCNEADGFVWVAVGLRVTSYMRGDYNTRCDTGENESVVLTDFNVNVEKCFAECPKMSILGMGLSPFPELYANPLPKKPLSLSLTNFSGFRRILK